MTTWRLLLTRPAEECVALAATLADQGVYSSSLPLLEIEPLEISPEQRSILDGLARYNAVIVVSKPAARLGVALLEPLARTGQPWFSVGAATAQILADAGLPVSFPQQGDDSEALLALPALQQALATSAAPRVLILRGEGGREALADCLRGQGVTVDYLQLYRRRLPHYAVAALPERVYAERLNGLVVSSGQGLQHLLELAGAEWPNLARLPLFVPSPRVAELAIAAGARAVVDCRGASAAALLAALRENAPAAL